MTREEWCKYANDDQLLFADGFDEAIIGITSLITGEKVVTYDASVIIAILMTRDGMNDDEAVEFFDFNVVGAYVGERTPIFVPHAFMQARAKLRRGAKA